jgi:hypothetical protein
MASYAETLALLEEPTGSIGNRRLWSGGSWVGPPGFGNSLSDLQKTKIDDAITAGTVATKQDATDLCVAAATAGVSSIEAAWAYIAAHS